jgi:hypothetical protein
MVVAANDNRLATAQSVLGYRNFDAVQLRFSPVPTGITKVEDRSEATGMERGAVLLSHNLSLG